ncbi:MAG: class I SAM-dependent methyltransferase [Opitutales bacterium]
MDISNELNQEGLQEHFKTFFRSQSTDFRASSIAKLIGKQVDSSCDKILDLGCGSCVVSAHLLRMGLDVTSCDTSEAMIQMAHQTLTEENLATDKLHLMDIAQCHQRFLGSFDTIINLDVIEHIKNDQEALNQIYEILAPSGRLLLSVPAHPFLYGPKDEQVGHYRRYSKSMLHERLDSAGFKNIRIRYWNLAGFLCVWLSLKVLNRQINETFRSSRRTRAQAMLNSLLRAWFQSIENHLPMPTGLTLIAQAEKPDV